MSSGFVKVSVWDRLKILWSGKLYYQYPLYGYRVPVSAHKFPAEQKLPHTSAVSLKEVEETITQGKYKISRLDAVEFAQYIKEAGEQS
jgi:hypothetical protein